VLWVLGSASPRDLCERAAAVVGTRAATGYGEHVTRELVTELVEHGVTVVSGAAYGIDGVAHRAALAAGGATVAVLACGVDRAYPAGHVRLLRRIAEAGGLVLSEYAPGVTPARHQFLVRNRLVAALSEAVVVTEAGRRSGARNTAAWARRLGRPALAVPGSVLSVASVGTNRMIRDGEARLVAEPSDVLEEIGGCVAGEHRDTPCDTPESDELGLKGDTFRIYRAIDDVSRTPHRVSEESGVPLPMVRSVLPDLELRGLIARTDAGWHRKNPKSRG
jgi:DNA processing protein